MLLHRGRQARQLTYSYLTHTLNTEPPEHTPQNVTLYKEVIEWTGEICSAVLNLIVRLLTKNVNSLLFHTLLSVLHVQSVFSPHIQTAEWWRKKVEHPHLERFGLLCPEQDSKFLLATGSVGYVGDTLLSAKYREIKH